MAVEKAAGNSRAGAVQAGQVVPGSGISGAGLDQALNPKRRRGRPRRAESPRQDVLASDLHGNSSEHMAELLIYAAGLSQEETKLFALIKEASPGEEIALLRIFIRRMLALVMEAGSLKEMFQTMNALGYIAGRLAKLFEVQLALYRQSGDDAENKALLNVLQTVVDKIRQGQNTNI